MALAKIRPAFLLMITLVGVSLGAVHGVGDCWMDYHGQYRLQSVGFFQGLPLFEYNNQFHNVKQVTLLDLQSCNAASPIAVYTTGSDSITLKTPGHYYFLCGIPGHCEAGQKLHVMVTPASLRPSASPRPTPAAPLTSWPTVSSSQSSPSINLDDQSNASSSSLQIPWLKIWSALISLAIFVTGFAY